MTPAEPEICWSHGRLRCAECRELDGLREENQRLRAALEQIQGMAGNPDASEACRLIIQRANEALEGEG